MSPRRNDSERLRDILEAIEAIQRHFTPKRTVFETNELLRYFILKHIEILGEAVFRLSEETKTSHPEVPWERIAKTRHRLVHDYWEVDWEIVWRICTDYLEPLHSQVSAIIAERQRLGN